MNTQQKDKIFHNIKTNHLTRCAIFVSLLSLSSQLSISMGPIPMNMATLMVLLTGLLLGTLYGSLCIAIYLILGTLGLPIFSNFGGGIGHIMGPTGGFLLSYLPACCIMGLASKYKYSNKRPKNFTRLLIIIYCTVATLLIYTIGTIWFANYTKKTIDQSLVLTVYPFLIGDAFKIAISIVLHEKLTRLKI